MILIFLVSCLARKNGALFLLFFGVGLAFLFDELNFITGSYDYWSLGNLLSILLGGILLLLVMILVNKKKENNLLKEIKSVENQNILVSVVVPALNEERFLAKTLKSIINQNYKNFEIIVVDNNSNDNTADIARSFGVKLVFESKQGAGNARQAGFLAARGKIIASTDADTILPQDWISRIVAEFKNDKNLAAFGGLYVLYSGSTLARIVCLFFAYPAWCIDKFFTGGWSLPGVNFAARKDAFLKIGGFNTDLRLGEDANLSRRLRAVGKVKLDPDFLVKTSGRRFRNGLFLGLSNYIPNCLIRMLFKKNKFNDLPEIRTEKPSLGRFSFLPFLFCLIALFMFFYSSSPVISQAKEWKAAKNKLATTSRQLAVKEKKVRRVLIDNVAKKAFLAE